MNYEKKCLKYKNQIAGAQNIRLFIEDSWQPTQDYHVFAFNEHLFQIILIYFTIKLQIYLLLKKIHLKLSLLISLLIMMI